jgi:putative FmdB family regulatory protein
MILYDYKCPKHSYFEAWAKMEDVIIRCPDCGLNSRRYPGLPTVITASGGRSLPGIPWRD